MKTRRDILIGASCAALAATAPLTPAQGFANTRRNIVDVEKDAGALQTLRDAIDVLRKKDDYGRRPAIDGWFSLATYHSQWCFGGIADYEVHYGWWFLPWHRAYLIHVERTLQEAINEPSLRIPYWDWVTTGALPGSVSEPRYRKGNETVINPLFDDQRFGPLGQGGQIDLADLGAPSKSDRELIAIDTFANFAGGHPDSTGRKQPGFLEATPHTYIHRAVGFDQVSNRVGLMTVGMGPLDPVFFLHHANVDRLWTMWLNAGGRRENPHDPVWRDHHFAFPETKKFKLLDYKIADLLDSEKSPGGYRYDRDGISTQDTHSVGTLVLHGVPISPLPATIRVFAQSNQLQTRLQIGSFSTIPSIRQTGDKMDVVLPINEATERFLSANQTASIEAESADAGGRAVPFERVTIDVRR
jgi:hypothetical protein